MNQNELDVFQGIVVRTGDPFVIDNGDETLALAPVSEDGNVKLGQEVTARRVDDGAQWELGDDALFEEV